MRAALLVLPAALAWSQPAAAQLDRISNKEAVAALKAALDKGARQAVSSLGRTDGFFGNPRGKIPLPESLQKAEGGMRRLGMGRYADELGLTMNRAGVTRLCRGFGVPRGRGSRISVFPCALPCGSAVLLREARPWAGARQGNLFGKSA